MTPAEQARAFVVMLLAGVCMGVVYDLLGPLRRVRGLCAAADLLFGLCCAAGIVTTALGLRCDAFRLYAFAGAACGLALYGATVGAVLRRVAAILRNRRGNGKEKYKTEPVSAGD